MSRSGRPSCPPIVPPDADHRSRISTSVSETASASAHAAAGNGANQPARSACTCSDTTSKRWPVFVTTTESEYMRTCARARARDSARGGTAPEGGGWCG